jgi:hypothetical protein
MDTSSSPSLWIVGLVVFLVGVVPVLAWARYRWAKLKPEIFPDQTKNDTGTSANPTGTLAARTERAARLITRARTLLEKEDAPEARIAAEALRKIEASSAETAPAIETLMTKALETAEVGSLLLGSGGLYVYVVVIPNRHEHAHLLRRYAPFSGGWRCHAELVRASLIASGEFSGLAALLLFLSPEGKESTLQLSCADANSILIPPTLVEGQDLKTAGVKTLDASVEFSLAA